MYLLIGIDITFFGFGLCLLQSIEGLFHSRGRPTLRVFFYIVNSIIILGIGLIARGVPQRYPGGIFLFFTSLFLIGPLNLMYYHSLLYPERKHPYRIWAHMMPAFFSFILEIIFQLQPRNFRMEFIESFLNNPDDHILIIPITAAVVHVLIYMVLILKIFLLDLGFRKSSNEFRFIGSVAFLVLMVVGLLFYGFIAVRPLIFISGSILNVFIHICLYMSRRLFPQFFTALKREIRQNRYEKSMLKGLDTELISQRVVELMNEDELYKDSEITLSSMAERLSLSPHQLSQLLNERMNISFRDFVNRFRIDEAKKFFTENPDANIMNVCFRVGFNSKSSFNAAFKKMTGCTPSEFKNGKGAQ